MATEEKKGWRIELKTNSNGNVREGCFDILFNDIHIGVLEDNSTANGTSPYIIINPYENLERYPLSISIAKDAHLKRVKGNKRWMEFKGC